MYFKTEVTIGFKWLFQAGLNIKIFLKKQKPEWWVSQQITQILVKGHFSFLWLSVLSYSVDIYHFCFCEDLSPTSRKHNDANTIKLAAYTGLYVAMEVSVDIWGWIN